MKISFDIIIEKLNGIKYEIKGEPIDGLTGFVALNEAGKKSVSFCKYRGDASRTALAGTKASLVFCWPDAILPDDNQRTYILIDNPRMHFFRILASFLSDRVDYSVADSAKIGKNCELGKISIGANVVIGNNVVIGDGTIITANVVIGDGTSIGRDVLIKSNTVIGQKGFGFEFDENKTPFAIPHIGGVRIGDNVEIGSNCTVVRGVLGDTIVSDFTKVDDHVHIGHNVEIGAKTMITACAEISGSVKIGNNCWLGPNCSLMNQIRIGNNVLIGLGAVVTKSLPDNAVAVGNPARIVRIKEEKESPWKGISR
ncbi:MAG TPA: UDP-3-O-(3-hydroxymyristoyl)glucosamine N-acyltransferase [Candidatus Pacearchaeota archaeon]|nr:UDP-3-O-(3-hydroxymyristoyl)glucosamine N-acyltransferase [Candidatus Pacearchaeota archaeon]